MNILLLNILSKLYIYLYSLTLLVYLKRNLIINNEEKKVIRIIVKNLLVTFRNIKIPSSDKSKLKSVIKIEKYKKKIEMRTYK